MEQKSEDEIVDLPTSVVEAFCKKLDKNLQNSDLPLSPISERRKKRPKSSTQKQDPFERLYVSPSPFKSPEDMKR